MFSFSGDDFLGDGDFLLGEYFTRFGVMVLSGDGCLYIFFIGGDSCRGGVLCSTLETLTACFVSIYWTAILKVD